MENLSEKYLKLLKEYEKLRNLTRSEQAPQDPECPKKLNQCSSSYSRLYQRKELLKSELKKTYGLWLPPRVHSFFSIIIPWIKKGFKISKSSEYRLDICNKCEFFTEKSTCQVCGCYMKGKVRIPQASCPLGKWKAEQIKKSTSVSGT
jgi:hypothetical protein